VSRPTRARRRYHRDRVVAKRAAEARRLGAEPAPVLGRLDDEQRYLGCHRARCGVCHPDKRWGGERTRGERAWRRAVELDS